MKTLLVLIVILTTAIAIQLGLAHEPEPKPPHAEHPEADVPQPLPTTGEYPGELITNLATWTQGVKDAEIAAYLDTLARQPATRSTPIVVAPRTGTSQASPSDGCGYADAIREAWSDTPDAEWAVAVAWRESHCDPAAYNPSGASGLFQLLGHQNLIDQVCGVGASPFDAACNIAAARALYQGAGRSPWAL